MGDVTLQPRTIRTVKSTAPVLREHGLEITRRMYELLFQDEQIKSLFNQSHHRGVGTQPRSLAGAVHAYAANIAASANSARSLSASPKSTSPSTSCPSTIRMSVGR